MRTKFIKKSKFTFLNNTAIIISIILVCFVVSIFLIRYFVQSSDPFSEKSNVNLDYLSFYLDIGEKYHKGEPIQFRMKITNTSSKPITINFPNSNEVDFLVYREDNWFFFKLPTLIWQSSIYNKDIIKKHSITLNAKESKVFSSTWPQVDQKGNPVKPGFYRIVGNVVTDDFTVSLTLKENSENKIKKKVNNNLFKNKK